MFVLGCVQRNKASDDGGKQSEEKAETTLTQLLILKRDCPKCSSSASKKFTRLFSCASVTVSSESGFDFPVSESWPDSRMSRLPSPTARNCNAC